MPHPPLALVAVGLTPALMGFTTSFLVGGVPKSAGVSVVGRPPSEIFGVLWLILYGLIGVAWVKQGIEDVETNISFGVLNIALCAWIVIYTRSHNEARVFSLWWLFVCLLVAQSVINYSEYKIVRLALTPLQVWLSFASVLSFLALQQAPPHTSPVVAPQ